MSKQSTLFQSWGAKSQKQKSVKSVSKSSHGASCSSGSGQVIDLCEEEDEDMLLAMAMEESLKHMPETSKSIPHDTNIKPKKGSSSKAAPEQQSSLFHSFGSRQTKPQTTLAEGNTDDMGGLQDIPSDQFNDQEISEMPDISDIPDIPGFDKYAGRTWIYPTNYSVRDYQYQIVKESLFKNTMVVLPTGLGKTFIAAVVMYNFYRWYPQGKVIFMAPTKPLVAQQIEACYNIMGIPQDDTAEMTGAMQPAERKKAWRVRRVFFLTPQVLTNDLSRSACPASDVKCVVVDEAHKALGNHAYCQVARELVKHSQDFRILALSATPGSDIKAVQQVLSNLLISHVELRSEESADIQKYTHERRVDKIVVPLGEELKLARERYLQILNVLVMRLKRQGVLYHRDAKSLSKFLVLKARDAFRQNPPQNLQRTQYGVIEGDFALCMSLYHGYELLQLHGLRSLYNFLDGIVSGEKSNSRARTELLKNTDFCDLLQILREKYDPIRCLDPNASFRSQLSATQKKPVALGHPKMAKLEEVVVEHFEKAGDTRIMIFSQYRDSVNEITEMLNRHRPLVKVMSFVGQSSAGKSSRGFTQKEQLKVMRQFREGGYNTLVSTCVGEEGLDIGDVDLIVCFDAHKSPIRLVQRMGRTGRKREGRIVMLVTEGKEEQIYNQSQYNKKSIHKAIVNGARSLVYYAHNPRMVPEGLDPACHRMYITVHTKFQTRAKSKNQAPQRNKITSGVGVGGKNAGGAAARDGLLTAVELQYWDHHYKVPECDIAALRPSKFLTLHNHKSRPAEEVPEGPELSLCEWTPWQNTLQPVHFVGHSASTRDYVGLMQFMDVQAAVGTCEDNYGLEMALYLNEEDILKPGQKNIIAVGNHGILKFCSADPGKATTKLARPRKGRLAVVPSDDDSDRDDFNDGNHGNRDTRSTSRRHRPLPQFDDDVGGADTSDDLPAVLCERDDAIDLDDLDVGQPCAAKSKGKVGGRGKVKNGRFRDVVTDGSSTKPTGTTTRSFKSKLQAFEFKDDQNCSKGDENDTKTGVRRKVATKKRHSSEHHTSVIQPIMDADDGDFESDAFEKFNNVSNEIVHETVDNDEHTDRVKIDAAAAAATADEDDRSLDEIPEVEMPEPDDMIEDVDLPADDSEEPDLELSQLLPISAFNDTSSESSRAIPAPKRVKSPPPLEDIADAFAELDKRGKISPVDIVDLVDAWGATCSNRASISDSVLLELHNDSLRFSQDRDAALVAGENTFLMTAPPHSDQPQDIHRVHHAEEKNESTLSETKMSVSSDAVRIASSDLTSSSLSPKCQGNASGYKPLFKQGSLTDSHHQNHEEAKRQRQCSFTDNRQSEFGISQMDIDDFNVPFTLEVPSAEGSDEIQDESVKSSDTATPLHKEAEPTNGSMFSERRPAHSSVNTPFRVPPGDTSTPMLPPRQADLFRKTVVSETPDVAPPQPRSSLKAAHQSFFCDEDSMFSAVSLGEIDCDSSRHMARSGPAEDAPKKLTPGEVSQFTFTQALACINDTVNCSKRYSGSSGDKSTDSFKSTAQDVSCPSVSAQTSNLDQSGDKVPQNDGNDSSLQSFQSAASHLQEKTPEGEQTASKISLLNSSIVHQPQFDLGFDLDLDDFEDDMIPPSPEHVIRPPSSQRFSITMAGMLESGSETSRRVVSGHEAVTEAEPSVNHGGNESPESDSHSPSLLEPKCPSAGARGQRSRPVAVVTPTEQAPSSSPLRESYRQATVPQVYWDADAETMDMSVLEDDFHPDADSDEAAADEAAVDEAADESIIQAPKRRKKAAVIMSPDTSQVHTKLDVIDISEFKTPIKPAPKARKRSRVPSEEDSPITRPPAKRKIVSIEDDDFIDDMDDDFIRPAKPTSKILKPQASSGWLSKSNQRLPPQNPRSKLKSRGRRPGNGFLDVEAEVSDSGDENISEDDEDGSDLDDFDDSFINDASQMSQTVADPVDMRAVYMRSVRSPHMSRKVHGLPGKNRADIFSQVPQQDAEYMEDSFCVADEFEDSEMVDDFYDNCHESEDSLLVELHRKKTSRSHDVKVSRKVKVTGSRRRVVHPSSSSSEEDNAGKENNQASPKQRAADHSKQTHNSAADNSFTHVISLRSRIQNKLDRPSESVTNNTNSRGRSRLSTKTFKSPPHVGMKPPSSNSDTSGESKCVHYPPEKNQRRESVDRIMEASHVVRPVSVCVDQPTFSLGLDGLDMSDDEDDMLCDISTPVLPKVCKSRINGLVPTVTTQSGHATGSSCGGRLRNSEQLASVPFTSYATSDTSHKCVSPPGILQQTSPPGGIVSRAERLRLSRLKQEEFRKKLEAKKSLSTSRNNSGVISREVAHSGSVTDTSSALLNRNTDLSTSTMSASFTKMKNKVIVFIDSKEINGAQDLVSNLRSEHGIHTVVKSLGHCDYILSNRMAVERKVISDFTNGSYKAKLLERVRLLCELFDRPCLVVEKDRVRPGEAKGSGKPLFRSKYVETVLAGLAQTHIKVMYTESQQETAALLSELCLQEHRKNMAVSVPVELSAPQEQVLRFYLSLPKVSYITALNLLHRFKSVLHFINSPVGVLEQTGQLPRPKAQEIHTFLRHRFDAQMLKSGPR